MVPNPTKDQGTAGCNGCIIVTGEADKDRETIISYLEQYVTGGEVILLDLTNAIIIADHSFNQLLNIIETKSTECTDFLPKPKQPCFTERGHDWWTYTVFLPIPEKDINISRIPGGDRSPPRLITNLSPEIIAMA